MKTSEISKFQCTIGSGRRKPPLRHSSRVPSGSHSADRFVLIASCLARSLLIIPRLFICAEIAHVPGAVTCLLSFSLSSLSGSKLVSKVDFSRRLIATASLLRSNSKEKERERERERERKTDRDASNRETFDCIRESIESVAAQKGRPGTKQRDSPGISIGRDGPRQADQRGENTRTRRRRERESGEPGEAAAWKKDLDCAAVRDVDGCCRPSQPPTAKNLIRCHNYTQWRSTSARGTVARSIAPKEGARFRGQRKWFLLMGFMLTNADWPGEEDPTCRFLSLDARFFRDDATCSVSVLSDDRGERPDPSIRTFRGIRDTCRRLIRI